MHEKWPKLIANTNGETTTSNQKLQKYNTVIHAIQYNTCFDGQFYLVMRKSLWWIIGSCTNSRYPRSVVVPILRPYSITLCSVWILRRAVVLLTFCRVFIVVLGRFRKTWTHVSIYIRITLDVTSKYKAKATSMAHIPVPFRVQYQSLVSRPSADRWPSHWLVDGDLSFRRAYGHLRTQLGAQNNVYYLRGPLPSGKLTDSWKQIKIKAW